MSSINDSPAQSPAPASGPGEDGGYPEQRHAGAVGYGPEYMKGAVSTIRASWMTMDVG